MKTSMRSKEKYWKKKEKLEVFANAFGFESGKQLKGVAIEFGCSMMAYFHACDFFFDDGSCFMLWLSKNAPPQEEEPILFWTLFLIYGFCAVPLFLVLDKIPHDLLLMKFENMPHIHKYFRFALHAVLSYYVWPWLTWFLFCVHSKYFREITPEYIRFPTPGWTDNMFPSRVRAVILRIHRMPGWRPKKEYYFPELYCVLHTMQMCMTINRMFTLETTLLLKWVLVLNFLYTIKSLNDDGAIILVSKNYLVLKRRLYARLVVKRRRELLCEIIEDVQNVKIIEEMTGGVDEFSPEVVRNIGMEEFDRVVTAAEAALDCLLQTCRDFIVIISMYGRVSRQKMKIEDMPVP